MKITYNIPKAVLEILTFERGGLVPLLLSVVLLRLEIVWNIHPSNIPSQSSTNIHNTA